MSLAPGSCARLSALLAVLVLGACAESQAARPNLRYTDEARSRYERAMQQYRNEEWPEATESFRAVRRQFGLSRWGWLADLRLADIDFKQERYTEALQSFRSWIRYHPTQPEVTYAHFMIARCYFSQVPTDWLLVPSGAERDQSSAHDAESALARFVRDYPDAPEIREARALLGRARALLARHEIYVADFYAAREAWPAAVSRLLGVLADYRGSGLEPQALIKLGETYLRMGRRPEARGAFLALLSEYPRSEQAPSARRFLAMVGPGPSVPVGEPAQSPETTPPEAGGGS